MTGGQELPLRYAYRAQVVLGVGLGTGALTCSSRYASACRCSHWSACPTIRTTPLSMSEEAGERNLNHIDVDLPRDAMVAFTGVRGTLLRHDTGLWTLHHESSRPARYTLRVALLGVRVTVGPPR